MYKLQHQRHMPLGPDKWFWMLLSWLICYITFTMAAQSDNCEGLDLLQQKSVPSSSHQPIQYFCQGPQFTQIRDSNCQHLFTNEIVEIPSKISYLSNLIVLHLRRVVSGTIHSTNEASSLHYLSTSGISTTKGPTDEVKFSGLYCSISERCISEFWDKDQIYESGLDGSFTLLAGASTFWGLFTLYLMVLSIECAHKSECQAAINWRTTTAFIQRKISRSKEQNKDFISRTPLCGFTDFLLTSASYSSSNNELQHFVPVSV